MFDVAIIGCGISGAAAAFELSRYHLSVVALERENDVATGTTRANSAVIHAGYDPEPGTLMAKLNVEGNRIVRELCGKLDVPYRQCGSLVLAFSEQDCGILETLLQRGQKNGADGLVIVGRERLLDMEPNVSPEAIAALYAPTAGIVCPWELTLALMETAVKNGVELQLNSEVQSIKKTDGGYRIITCKGEVEARYIVNAAGVYADTIHNMAAEPTFRIVPDRGEYYLLDKSEGTRVSHVVFQCPTKIGKGALIAPTVHGNLIVGPNNEDPGHADNTATTVQGLAWVAKAARRSVPAVNLGETIRNFAGVRAASDGDDFVIGEAADAPGFIDLAGIKSPGLTAAPAAAKLVIEILRKAGLALYEKERFDCNRKRVRFAQLTPEERASLVKEDSAYGRIVCRCELVTEGEMRDAMDSPIPPASIEGMKRRVGAGMGRCQGGFCGPRVMEFMSRELGVSPLEIPQDLRGSNLLIGETKENSYE